MGGCALVGLHPTPPGQPRPCQAEPTDPELVMRPGGRSQGGPHESTRHGPGADASALLGGGDPPAEPPGPPTETLNSRKTQSWGRNSSGRQHAAATVKTPGTCAV